MKRHILTGVSLGALLILMVADPVFAQGPAAKNPEPAITSWAVSSCLAFWGAGLLAFRRIAQSRLLRSRRDMATLS